MIRPICRTLTRSVVRPPSVPAARTKRLISTAPAHLKSRSWKSSALRWGIAGAGIYYYNTSPVFAEHPQHNLLNPNVDALEDEHSSTTLDALTASSRHKSRKDVSILQSAVESASEKAAGSEVGNRTAQSDLDLPEMEASPAELEEEAESQGAFNPVTGEINWDCSCLGGMAHGPCGPEFREAFSCFVYSTEEPKGMECIDKFQNMQNCFRAHPDVYKGELEDDEELDAELAQEREELTNQIAERKAADKARKSQDADGVSTNSEPSTKLKPQWDSSPKKAQASAENTSSSETRSSPAIDAESINEGQRSQINGQSHVTPIEAGSVVEEGELIPKAAHDASDATISQPKKQKTEN